MAQETLLSVYEVKKYSKISDLACDIQDILQVEQREARLNIGQTLYDSMLADIVDDSSTVDWTPGSYAADTRKRYKGIVKKATILTSNEPSHTDWIVANKFTDTCYEAFFTKFLGRYLALCIAKNSVVPMTASIEAQGMVEKHGDGFNPVSQSKIESHLRWFEANIEMIMDNMKQYVCNAGLSTECKTALKMFGVVECCTSCNLPLVYTDIGPYGLYCTCGKKHKRQTFMIG